MRRDDRTTRRDFVDGVLTTMASLAVRRQGPDPGWAERYDGFGGVGDYARSHGNPWSVAAMAHRLRDGGFKPAELDGVAAEETYDLVVVGAGAAGLGAAFHFNKETNRRGRCLILESHPMFGGSAKQNEIMIKGARLVAPQASNAFLMPRSPSDKGGITAELAEIGMPLEYQLVRAEGISKPMFFDPTNWAFYLSAEESESYAELGPSGLVRNPWGSGLSGLGLDADVRRDLLRFRTELGLPPLGTADDARLDAMSFDELLTREYGLVPGVARYLDRITAGAVGVGTAHLSAYAAGLLPLAAPKGRPGPSRRPEEYFAGARVAALPGGNGYVARWFVKHLVPDGIEGPKTPEAVVRGGARFERLDRVGNPVRLRLNATVLRIRNDGPGESGPVRVVYERGGRLHAVRARHVVVASGAWVNKYLVPELPAKTKAAMNEIDYAPFIVANVALTNWRFLERLGVSAVTWSEGDFGTGCNLANPVAVGSFQPVFHPDRPAVLQFIAPLVEREPRPGMTIRQQLARARVDLYATPFREYERRIRSQMNRVFAGGGFDSSRDIGALVLNRWGHAIVVPGPGQLVARNGEPTPFARLREPVGRIHFANAEQQGMQHFTTAVAEGRRAVHELLSSS